MCTLMKKGGIEVEWGETSPPDYLSESELISLMEKNGIGTDASIPVHINNICERNFVQVQAGRKLVPTALGISLIRGYQCIDPDLCLPDIRSFIEQQITLVAKGQVDHSRVVEHVLQQFKQKFIYFVKQLTKKKKTSQRENQTISSLGSLKAKGGERRGTVGTKALYICVHFDVSDEMPQPPHTQIHSKTQSWVN
ncbi:DNA topoisomerase 3-beta [Vitis vinifera]|uniref:DNA topoisomerase n=1 Tax=Vitis vinifera TaxID=29760 RepID=A0A438HCB2_VITVI|nr:DNA topoisomerase 3-beta [Vitis vinifera]